MPVVDNKVITDMTIYVDDSSHNMPAFVYAKQYDANSRFIRVKLMTVDGQYVVTSNTAQLNATKPDGTVAYVPGVTNADGTVTIELPSELLAVEGNVLCDVSVMDEEDNETAILTSSTFYIIVDKSNYDEDAIESSDDFSLVAEAITQMAGYKDAAQAAATSAQGSASTAEAAATSASEDAAQVSSDAADVAWNASFCSAAQDAAMNYAGQASESSQSASTSAAEALTSASSASDSAAAAAASATQAGSVVNNSVRFDTAQSKTAAEKSQAQANIGLGTAAKDLSRLKNIVKGERKRGYNVSLWSKGGISTSTGGNSGTSNTRMRTDDYLEYGIDVIEPQTGYKMILYAYNPSAGTPYQGTWNGSGFSKAANWLTEAVSLYGLGYRNYKYKLVFAKSDDSTLNVNTDPQNIVFYYNTDTSLAESGMPADAKVVNDELTDIKNSIDIIAPTELRGFEGWTYYGAYRLETATSGGNEGKPVVANAYATYMFAVTNDIQVWSDSNVINVGDDFIIEVFNSATPSTSSYMGLKGRQTKDAYGVITTDTLPKENSKMTVLAGQYIGISVKKECMAFRLYANKDSGYDKYLKSDVVLDTAQVNQVIDAIVKPIVYKDSTKVYIYVPTSNNKYYIEYKITKVNHPENFAIGWRLNGIQLCNLDKSNVAGGLVMGTGEWETALTMKNSNNTTVYMGLGNHGYEQQVNGGFNLFIDGIAIGENDTFTDRPFKEIQFINKLEMLDPRETSNPPMIGYHTRIDTIDGVKKTITIANKLDFSPSSPIRIIQGYLFMSSLERENSGGHLMTDTFIDNVDYVLTDCSSTTFSPTDANHGVGENKPGVTEYKFWGSYYDLWGYAKVLRREAPQGIVASNYVKNYDNQNKIYMSICNNGDATNGDTWIMETEFFLDSGYGTTS